MTYLLDTDTVSYLYRGQGKAIPTFVSKKPYDITVSAISLAELRLGAQRKGSKKINRWLDVCFESVMILPFDKAAAEVFGRVAAKLFKEGRPITLIASQALANKLTLVTHNRKHFSKISGLRIEDWL
jgi:tRNA(fMet)-specific endonuclease VapC